MSASLKQKNPLPYHVIGAIERRSDHMLHLLRPKPPLAGGNFGEARPEVERRVPSRVRTPIRILQHVIHEAPTASKYQGILSFAARDSSLFFHFTMSPIDGYTYSILVAIIQCLRYLAEPQNHVAFPATKDAGYHDL